MFLLPSPPPNDSLGVSAHDPNSLLCQEPSRNAPPAFSRSALEKRCGPGRAGGPVGADPRPASDLPAPPGPGAPRLVCADCLWKQKPEQGTGDVLYQSGKKVASGLPQPVSLLVADWDVLTSSTEEGGGEDIVSGR